jgi:hypothetical protein
MLFSSVLFICICSLFNYTVSSSGYKCNLGRNDKEERLKLDTHRQKVNTKLHEK